MLQTGRRGHGCALGAKRDCRRVGECDGLDPSKTLKWVRKVSSTEKPLAIAKATAEGLLVPLVRDASDWETVKEAILIRCVSPIFALSQRQKLPKMKQGKDSFIAYSEEFWNVANEAYPEGLPDDQQELIQQFVKDEF